MLFSQAAGTATSRPVSGPVADITMRTGHRAVLAFEDRPGRRTATLEEHKFIGLWRGTFRTDAPNAILTGRDPQGRNRRVVVTITRAARTPDGVRYRMRALRGIIPTALAQVNLMVDDVPMSALLAYLKGQGSGPAQYEALINALRFPEMTTVTAAPTVLVRPGTTMTIGQGSAPTTVIVSTITVQPGATLVMQGPVWLRAQNLTLAPGSRIVLPGSPTLFTLQAAGLPACAAPASFSWTGTLTQVRSLLSPLPGVSLVQPPPQTWPGPSVTSSPGPGPCTVTWSLPRAPATSDQQVPLTDLAASLIAPPSTKTVTVQTTSTTQQVVEVSGAGVSLSAGAVLSLQSQPTSQG